MARVLYITYDGLLEPMGYSQVFQYLRHLAKEHDIFLISFEKGDDWGDADRREVLLRQAKEAGIFWTPLRYHRKPSALATAFDVLLGLLVASWLLARHRIAIVHARSYVSSVIALALKKLFCVGFIFDMRGFWADERVERAGLGKESRLYRVAKWFERHFLCNADVVVSLTHAGVKVIGNFPYFSEVKGSFQVIPTCTDLAGFPPAPARKGGGFTLGYVGSADTAYLFDPVLRCFGKLVEIRPDARLLVLTRSSHDRLRQLLQEHRIDPARVELKSVAPGEVAAEMARMDAGIFFVKPGFSTAASVPTKLGEFLSCGIPCLGNAGIGDLEAILEGESVGIILREFTPDAEGAAVASLLALCDDPQIRTRCAAVASRTFDLHKGVASYDTIYRLLCGDAAAITCKESAR
jgi:glycosyltransferase involved in cell wall biosynthesis